MLLAKSALEDLQPAHIPIMTIELKKRGIMGYPSDLRDKDWELIKDHFSTGK